jgi:hypothetical protein
VTCSPRAARPQSNGQVRQSVRAAGGTITLSGPIGEDALIAAGTASLGPSARVGRDLLAGTGSAYINGPVTRNVLMSGGEVTLAADERFAPDRRTWRRSECARHPESRRRALGDRIHRRGRARHVCPVRLCGLSAPAPARLRSRRSAIRRDPSNAARARSYKLCLASVSRARRRRWIPTKWAGASRLRSGLAGMLAAALGLIHAQEQIVADTGAAAGRPRR